jgi:hypothetical protein
MVGTGIASQRSRGARGPQATVAATPHLAAVDAAPSLTAGVTTSRGSSHQLAMGPTTGPRSSRRAGQHVTAERQRQQASCQRSRRTSARLACAPCASARRARTYPGAPSGFQPLSGRATDFRTLGRRCSADSCLCPLTRQHTGLGSGSLLVAHLAHALLYRLDERRGP